MNSENVTIKACRLCSSSRLTPLFSLGNLYVSNFVDRTSKSLPRCPLELVYCEKCTLVQLRHTAPQELLYSRHYWYRSGINPVISEDLRQIANLAKDLVHLSEGDVVLDIGANDGTLLSNYPINLTRVGCEPARNLLPYLKKVTPNVIDDFWSLEAWQELMGNTKARFVTAIGMFYDMENPNQFIADVSEVLDDEGVFVAQLMCLNSMLEKNDLGNICHEHLEYYTYRSLIHLFESNDLEIFKVEENEINGGSYRLFARRLRNGSVTLNERCSKNDILRFFNRVKANKRACLRLVKKVTKEGNTIYAYGASTKGNTILQYYGLDSGLIRGVADKDSKKWGKFTVGTWIPITSEARAREQADFLLILPWAFWRAFQQRERDWLSNGGKFIVPLPSLRLVGN